MQHSVEGLAAGNARTRSDRAQEDSSADGDSGRDAAEALNDGEHEDSRMEHGSFRSTLKRG